MINNYPAGVTAETIDNYLGDDYEALTEQVASELGIVHRYVVETADGEVIYSGEAHSQSALEESDFRKADTAIEAFIDKEVEYRMDRINERDYE